MSAEGVPELVDALTRLGDPLQHPDLVRNTLAQSALRWRRLRPRLGFAAGTYARHTLFRCAQFEVLALAWDRGAKSPIHDHDGQSCWFVPLEGAFEAQDYDILRGGQVPGVAELAPRDGPRLLAASGVVLEKDAEDAVHRVSLAPTASFGVTLHVYARPVASCLVFDVDRQVCFRRALHDAPAGSGVSLPHLRWARWWSWWGGGRPRQVVLPWAHPSEPR